MSERRPEIPTAADELLQASQRRVGAGEGRLNLRSLKPVGFDDDATESAAREIANSYGAHAQIPPSKSGLTQPTARPAPAVIEAPKVTPERTKIASFRVDLPDYLDQELTMRSARDRVTKGYLILDALRRAGFNVREEDLVTDRRRTRYDQ